MFSSRKFANLRSTKALTDFAAVYGSQPTPATLLVCMSSFMIYRHLDPVCSWIGDSLLTNTYSWRKWNHDLNILRKSILNLFWSSFTLIRNLDCRQIKIFENLIFVRYTRPAPWSSLHEIEWHQSLLVLPHLSQNSFWLDTVQKAPTQSRSSSLACWSRKWKIRYVWRVWCSFLEAGVP